MLPFRHDSPPSTREKELVHHRLKPTWLSSQRQQTGWAGAGGGAWHPACSTSQLPSQVGLRQEGRVFPPALPPSLTLLAAPSGLQCSIILGKGTKGTISSEGKYSPRLHLETRWIYWAEPLKENLNYIVRNFGFAAAWPHPYQLHSKRKRGRASVRQSAVSLHTCARTLPHTIMINMRSYSWEEPSDICLLLKIPTKAHRKHQAENA